MCGVRRPTDRLGTIRQEVHKSPNVQVVCDPFIHNSSASIFTKRQKMDNLLGIRILNQFTPIMDKIKAVFKQILYPIVQNDCTKIFFFVKCFPLLHWKSKHPTMEVSLLHKLRLKDSLERMKTFSVLALRATAITIQNPNAVIQAIGCIDKNEALFKYKTSGAK